MSNTALWENCGHCLRHQHYVNSICCSTMLLNSCATFQLLRSTMDQQWTNSFSNQEQTVKAMQNSFPGDGLKTAPLCVHCGKLFTNNTDMRNHIKAVHDKIRDVICDICAKGFPSKSALSIHRMGHTGEKNFPCHICGQSYKTKHYLIIHTRLHTGEKPHCCEECGKAFADPSALKNHQKQHLDNQSTACEICGKVYKMKKNLKRHMIVHSNGNLSDTGPRIYSNDFKLDVLKKVQEIGISATAKLVKV